LTFCQDDESQILYLIAYCSDSFDVPVPASQKQVLKIKPNSPVTPSSTKAVYLSNKVKNQNQKFKSIPNFSNPLISRCQSPLPP
jgi:hypothetical protein